MHRTSRVLMGLACVSLAVSVSSGVAAQDEGRTLAGADGVTGQIVWLAQSGVPAVSLERGVEHYEDLRYTYDAQASDSRVAGRFEVLGDSRLLFTGPVELLRGPVELVNDEGRWVGEWSGGFEHDMGWRMVGYLEGEGGYEGFTYLMHSERDFYDGSEFDTNGVIFEGRAPGAPAEENPPVE
jgi:hypothetical protein